jgi:hypothetical protein
MVKPTKDETTPKYKKKTLHKGRPSEHYMKLGLLKII